MPEPATLPPSSAPCLAGGGEMGSRMRALDWSRTPAGPVEGWPRSLKTAVQILLHSRYPMFVWWGRELTNFYNDGYISMLGKRHPWALGRSAPEIWHEIWDAVGPQAELVLGAGQSTWNEQVLLVMERNGYTEETYFTFSYSPVPDDEAGVGGVFCAVFEDTERVLGERRLRALRQLGAATAEARTVASAGELAARSLAEHPADIPFALLYLLEPDGRTARLAGMAGLPSGHPAAPATIEVGTGAEAADGDLWPLRQALAGRGTVVGGLAGRGLPGGPWPEPADTAMVLPLATGQEQPVGFLVAGASPRRAFDDSYQGFFELLAGSVASALGSARAYEEERRRAEALAELDRAKTAFFGNVSHEFRTPLTLMLGPLEDLLARPEWIPAEAGEQLAVVHRNGLRLLKLVNTLLDFSRLEAGRVQAVYEPTDLAAFTADLASVFRSAIERAGLRLRIACPRLPEPVYVDRDLWEKVVLNLLSNALKFTLEGEIAVTLGVEGGAAVLRVRDTGIGIAAGEIPFLFERFRRVAGARGRTHEGTGIGLALVQELVHLHGGTVGVESVPGEGSTFTVTLPLGTAHLPPERIGGTRSLAATSLGAAPFVEEALRWLPAGDGAGAEGAAARGPERLPVAVAGGAGPRPRIVLADDNADMREYVERLLGARYEVEAVDDGAAALAAVRRQRPDLVLADVMMPELDGFGLLKGIRAEAALDDVPVILLSARAGEESRIEGLTAGADDYLVKPFSARELLARVGAHLEMQRVRREARRRVEDNEQRLRLALEAARMVAWEWDLATGTTLRSAGAAELLGLGSNAAGELFALIHADDAARVREAAERAAHGEGAYEVEFRVVTPDGRELWMADRGELRRGEDGLPQALTGVMIDVTERRRAAEELRRAKEEAEAAGRAKDAFLAMLSHELRSPLTPVLLTLPLLEGHPGLPPELLADLQTIRRSVELEARLIDDLLDLTRVAQGKLQFELEEVDVHALLRSSCGICLADGKVRLRLALLARSPLVRADPARLQQVFWNLLNNAHKFTSPGGEVIVATAESGGRVRVEVRDTGVGIEPELLPRIFDAFEQGGAATTRRFGGLGLGLAISRIIAVAMGGTLTAASEGRDRGAAFTLELPAMAGTASRDLRAEPAVVEKQRALRILVVEDDPATLEVMPRLLGVLGHHVRATPDVASALAAAESETFDLVISDLGLPDGTGFELMSALKARHNLPGIALSGYGMEEDVRKSLESGFLGHLTKPVDIERLKSMIRRTAGVGA